MNKIFSVSILFILLIAVILAPITLSATKPDWVSVGKYAEYEVILEARDGTRVSGYIKLEVKEVHEDHAVIKVSTNVPEFGSRESDEKWYYSKSFGDIIVNPDELRAGGYPVEDKTVPAGTFKSYKVARGLSTAWYEASTGLLVYAEETTLGGRTIIQLKSTNIIGGFPWLLVLLAIIAVIVAVAVVAVVLVLVFRKALTTASTPTQPPTPETPGASPPPIST